MADIWSPNNPGISGLKELTTAELAIIQRLGGLTLSQGDVFYVNGSGQITNLGAGTSGQFLKTLGAGANPVWGDASAPTSSIPTLSRVFAHMGA